MDCGSGGHRPSPWSGYLGRSGAGKARTGVGAAGGVGASTVVPRAEPQTTPPNIETEEQRLHVGVP